MTGEALQRTRATPASISFEDYSRAMLNILEDSSEETTRLQKMQRAVVNILEDSAGERGRQEDTQRAALNILEDFEGEKRRLEDTQRAALNILEDFDGEKTRLEHMQRAVINILEDSTGERGRQEDTQRAALNILEDFAEEKRRLEDTQRAAINILEDFDGEKTRLEKTQRAMLNLLDDFGMERERTEAVNLQLRETIDSLRRAKEAADASNRELEAFAYSVSHDLRTPLRSIAGFSHVLSEDYFDLLDEDGRDSLKRIDAATARMGRLIDDLLDLSRFTRAEMKRKQEDLSEMVRKIAEAKMKAQPDRKIDFVIEDGLLAEVDGQLLSLVFENLIDNALKFTVQCESARIEFGSIKKDGRLTYFLRDNGAGFDMEYVGKLFQPFQRLHGINEFPGTGIGLATVKRIVERHGGVAWIEGEKGRGTTVYFSL